MRSVPDSIIESIREADGLIDPDSEVRVSGINPCVQNRNGDPGAVELLIQGQGLADPVH